MKASLAAAMLAAAAAAPALAAPSTTYGGSATITGLRYSVFDLNPNDGIAPSASFLGGLGAYSAVVNLVGNGGWESHYTSRTGSDSMPSPLASAVRGGASGSAAVVTDGQGQAALMTATGSARSGGKYDAFEVAASHYIDLELGAGTGVLIEGIYNVTAWAKQRAGALGAQGAMAFVTFGTADAGHDARSVEANSNPTLGKSFAQLMGDFSFSFRNDTADSKLMFGGVRAWTSGGQVTIGSAVPPIPEPGTYALMAAGLGVVGFVARRRKATAE